MTDLEAQQELSEIRSTVADAWLLKGLSVLTWVMWFYVSAQPQEPPAREYTDFEQFGFSVLALGILVGPWVLTIRRAINGALFFWRMNAERGDVG